MDVLWGKQHIKIPLVHSSLTSSTAQYKEFCILPNPLLLGKSLGGKQLYFPIHFEDQIGNETPFLQIGDFV